ncbi:restriction endonuclease [Methylocaldum gracile]
MPTITAEDLREIVRDLIAPTIEIHRASRAISPHDEYSIPNEKEPTDDEVTDFVLSNPLIDSETANCLTDPGFLGFFANRAEVTDGWISEFREQVNAWAQTREWYAADLVWYHDVESFNGLKPDEEIWTSKNSQAPCATYLAYSPSHLILAEKLLREGRLLSELSWRDFEKLIAELLADHGWKVTLMQGSKDGGIDVLAEKEDYLLGHLKAVWQAKKYSEKKKVQLSHLRELSAVVDITRATKGIIVTTSTLTKGAIEWIRKDTYRLSSKDGNDIKRWIRRTFRGHYKPK